MRWLGSRYFLLKLSFNKTVLNSGFISNGEIIEIGASADNKPGSSAFFDKLYYIDDKEFEHIDDFGKNLQAFSDNGNVVVISIDDCPPPDCSWKSKIEI